MGSRQIKAALKGKGVDFERVEYVWCATPGEMVPAYDVVITADAADQYGEDQFNQFDNTEQAIEWVEGLAPFTKRIEG